MKSIAQPALILAIASVLALTIPVLAQPMGMQGHHMGHAGTMGAQLTPDQQQTVQKITNAHKPAFTRLSRRLWAKELQLQAALSEDRIDDARVKALTGEINKIRSDLFSEQVAMQAELARAGLAYYALGGGGMMGPHMAGSCPMMDGGGRPGAGGEPGG